MQDVAPFDGIPNVIIKAMDPVTNREVARTITRAKGDYSFEVPAGSSYGYQTRPELERHYFMPTCYRVYGSMNVPSFKGHIYK